MFTKEDFNQFKTKGIDTQIIYKQIENFKKGFPYADLIKPATIGNGIERLNEDDTNEFVKFYDNAAKKIHIIKFVPASGAASRMFKALFGFLENYKGTENDYNEFLADKGFNSVYNFINRLTDFAFFEDLKNAMKKDNIDIFEKIEKKEYHIIIDYLLNDKGLNYGKRPKGLLKFHSYTNNNRFSFEEHLVEAANYGTSKNNKAYIHFTVSPEHLDRFTRQVESVKSIYEDKFGITYDVSFSVQKSSTDTIAVDLKNNPFREDDGKILFRPGGHGALIENLNDLDGDVIFIKNIDNVVPDRLKTETTIYKKTIGGILLKLQSQVFKYLNELDKTEKDENLIAEISEFAQKKLNINIPAEFDRINFNGRKDFLYRHLNRPVRVCGMVKNEGEPGGGPFWVKNSNGEVSLQIVESSQVNQDDAGQKEILQSSTHFNPVDLVCGIKNYKGEQFDLHKYIDSATGFISIKSKDGKNLKAQELPGLWNGAMANWITIFVEVPVITFNPVKTVNDLLRTQHQPG